MGGLEEELLVYGWCDCKAARFSAVSVALFALLAPCLGCWEEIHYVPAAQSPDVAERDESSQPSTPAAATGLAEAADPVGETTIADAGASRDTGEESGALAGSEGVAPEPPSTSDLFSGDSAVTAQDPSTTIADGELAASRGETLAEESAEDAAAESVLPTPADSAETAEGGEPAEQTAKPISSAQRRLAWQAVSKWSLAAAIYAKGLPSERYQPILEEAAAAAAEVGVQLPALPTAPQSDDLEATVIEALRGEAAVQVANSVGETLGPAETAAADLALRTHLLLLTYSPRSADAALHAAAIRQAAERSDLPKELWQELADLVEQRAPFAEVRQAVFDLHRRVDAKLGE